MLYGKDIVPSCGLCERGTPLSGGEEVLCPKNGVVACGYRCRRFKYDPLKREPRPRLTLPKFDQKDFSID